MTHYIPDGIMELLPCVRNRQRKIRKLEIDIERANRPLRNEAVMPYSLYMERLNRYHSLQARHLELTGHYYQFNGHDVIRELNDCGVVA